MNSDAKSTVPEPFELFFGFEEGADLTRAQHLETLIFAALPSRCYDTHPPDDLSIENLKDILPEEGSTISCLKAVGTEPFE
jgi:hypothetical protein